MKAGELGAPHLVLGLAAQQALRGGVHGLDQTLGVGHDQRKGCVREHRFSQRIGRLQGLGSSGDSGLRGLGLAHVAQQAHVLALAVHPHLAHVQLDGKQAAVGAARLQCAVPAVAAAAAVAAASVVPGCVGRPGLGCGGGCRSLRRRQPVADLRRRTQRHQQAQAVAHHARGAVAEDGLRGVVHAQHGAVAVQGDDAVAGAVEHRVQPGGVGPGLLAHRQGEALSAVAQQRQAPGQQRQQQADRQAAAQHQQRKRGQCMVQVRARHLDHPTAPGHRQDVFLAVIGQGLGGRAGPQRAGGVGRGAGHQRVAAGRARARVIDQAMVHHPHLVGRSGLGGQGVAQHVFEQQHAADLANVGGAALVQRFNRGPALVQRQAHQHAGALVQQHHRAGGLGQARVAGALHHLASGRFGDAVVAKGRLIAQHRLVVGHHQIVVALARRVDAKPRIALGLQAGVSPNRGFKRRALRGGHGLAILHGQQTRKPRLHPQVGEVAVKFSPRNGIAGAKQGLEAGQHVDLVLHPLADVVEAQLAVALELGVGLLGQVVGAGTPGPQAGGTAAQQQGQCQCQRPACDGRGAGGLVRQGRQRWRRKGVHAQG